MPSTIKNLDWKQEMDKTILRYHVIALWVAVVFDMLFFVTDYLNIYDYWKPFLAFRTVVSLICLITVLSHKKLKINIEILGFIPVLLISIQNAYMWSVMDIEHLQKHAFAYIALFIGTGMFLFYRVFYSVLIVIANIIANIIFFYYNSALSVEEILVNGGFLTGAVAIFSVLLIRMRFRLTKNEIIARFALEQSKKEVEEKNKEIIDSINYAKRIQDALIPSATLLKKIVPNSFCVFLPKDIVSGDFYWATEVTTTASNTSNEKIIVFAVADCTGHGVSGAFVSIIGLKILNQSINEKAVNSPADALNFLNTEIYKTINANTENETVIRDGMDIAMCSLRFDVQSLKLPKSQTSNLEPEPVATLQYAGANNPVYIVRNKELIEIKADKQPIGSYVATQSFSNKTFSLQKDDVVYLFSDGYADQFGGEHDKKYNYKRFKTLLTEVAALPVAEQKETLLNAFNVWKGANEQLDDVCVIGVKI